jgi:hypothetical protein
VAFLRVRHEPSLCRTCANVREHEAWQRRREEAEAWLLSTIGATTIPWAAPTPVRQLAHQLADDDHSVRERARAAILAQADTLRQLVRLNAQRCELQRQAERKASEGRAQAAAAWQAAHGAALAAAEARCAEAAAPRPAARDRLEEASQSPAWTVDLDGAHRWVARWTPTSGIREYIQTWGTYQVWEAESPDGYRPAGSYTTTGWHGHYPVPPDRPAPIPAPEQVSAWAAEYRAAYEAARAAYEAVEAAYRTAQAERDRLEGDCRAVADRAEEERRSLYLPALQAIDEQVAALCRVLENPT